LEFEVDILLRKIYCPTTNIRHGKHFDYYHTEGKTLAQFKSLKKPPLSKEVENKLREAINAGIYKANDKLPSEMELVNQFQVSRVTVRDALRNLRNLGLIDVKRGVNAGAYVSEPNPQPITQSMENLIQMKKVNFAHLIEIRLYIEPGVARTAAQFRTSEDIDILSNLLDQAEKLSDTSPKEARLINVKFHYEVAKITRNALIIFLCESITQVHSAMIIKMTHSKVDKERVSKFIAEHRSILEAIVAEEPDEAFLRTKKHLIETYHTYSTILPDKIDRYAERRIRRLASL
jgi:DNA-binding FadR family transcriptional regulator